jgi:UrcA family protein
MIKSATATAMLGLALIGASPAQAQPVTAEARIAISDLDLATPKAKRILALRIDRAATAACSNGFEGLDPSARRAASKCAREIKAQAMAAAEARTGQRLAAR